jgi:putative transcriptional regulator
MPAMADSFFHRSVVYICEHDAKGAMGLIINKPTKVMVPELLNHLEIDNTAASLTSMPVLFGGPIEKGQGMVIHNSQQPWKTTLALSDSLFLTTSSDILEKIGTKTGPEKSLITLGYAGWEAGQLEDEIIDNHWLTVAADESIIFDTDAQSRWHKAAELLGIDINLMSNNMGHA